MGNVSGKPTAQQKQNATLSLNMGNIYGKPSTRQIKKLDELFQDLLRKASIDYSSSEICDIQAAVTTLLERVVAKVNERGIFKIRRIHQCGSMAEKTSLWKCDHEKGEIFTEFDWLALLENMHETSYDMTLCKGGVTLHELPINYKALDKYYGGTVLSERSRYILGENFDILFVKELDTSLRSLCSCVSVGITHASQHNAIVSDGKSSTHGSDICEVNMPTGVLRVNSTIPVVRDIDNKGPEKCSMVLHWTSKAKSLVVYDPLLLGQLQTMTSFPVYIDFLPTLEIFKENTYAVDPFLSLSGQSTHGRGGTVDLFNQPLFEDFQVKLPAQDLYGENASVDAFQQYLYTADPVFESPVQDLQLIDPTIQSLNQNLDTEYPPYDQYVPDQLADLSLRSSQSTIGRSGAVGVFNQHLYEDFQVKLPMQDLYGENATVDVFQQYLYTADPVFESPVQDLHLIDPTIQSLNQNLDAEYPSYDQHVSDQLADLSLRSHEEFAMEHNARAMRTTKDMTHGSSVHECFVVPKRCCLCNSTYEWRKSNSRFEIKYISNEMSEKHRKCYMIMKCILTFADRWLNQINSYHIKTIAMNHSKKCSVPSDSCAKCVLKMFDELLVAYQKEQIMSFSLGVNIFDNLKGNKSECIAIIKKCRDVLSSVAEFASVETFMMEFI